MLSPYCVDLLPGANLNRERLHELRILSVQRKLPPLVLRKSFETRIGNQQICPWGMS